MDFTLPDEHEMIQDVVRDFAETEIGPIAQEIEEEHRFPEEVFDELGELDLMGVPAPKEYGGAGGDYLMYAVVAEELGRVSGAVGLSYVAHTSLGLMPIVNFGTDEQIEEWARPLAEGDEIGAWALTEPSSGSDASDMDTVAEKDGSVSAHAPISSPSASGRAHSSICSSVPNLTMGIRPSEVWATYERPTEPETRPSSSATSAYIR